MKAVESLPRVKSIYCSSAEVKLLFYPLEGESVGACMVQREQMLAQSIVDGDSLLILVDNTNRIVDISIKQ